MRMPQKDIDQLITLHKELKRQKDADKLKCIIYWGKGYSWDEIKELLFISDGSIKNYLDAFEQGGVEQLFKTNYQGNNYKLTCNQEKVLSAYIERYNVLSSKQVVHYVKNRFGKIFSVNGMTRTLKRLGFSYRKPKRAPAKWDSYLENCFKFGYYSRSEFLQEDESLYFMDASGFEHNAKIDYGWMRKGKHKVVKTNTGRQRINVNGAYDIKTHEIVSICQKGNINSKSNIDLFRKVLEANPDKKKITIILDNARMNKSQEIFDFIRKHNEKGKTKLELFFTPPYCPHLNLIERFWKFMKKKVLANRYYASFAKFNDAVEYFLEKSLKKYKKELESLMTENFQTVARLGKLQI